jgi:hypothetical protein
MITKRTGTSPHIDSPPPPPHPTWCDPNRCAADAASQAHGFRSGVGGEHRSVPIPLVLATAMWLPARKGTAWLSEACAPWQCAIYLHVQVGDLELLMPGDEARRVLDDLTALLAPVVTAEEVADR